jgi:hypothetical protein
MRYLKDHWPHVVISVLASTFSTAFALGFAWATLGNRVNNVERQIQAIDKADVAQMRWRLDQNSADIAAIRADARQTEAAVAQINTRLGGIDAKLDAIAETLKRQ